MIYQYQERRYRSRRHRSSFIKKFCIFVILCVGIYAFVTTSISILQTSAQSSSPQKIISPIGKVLPVSISRGLEEVVEKSLEGTAGKYSVAVKNMRTKEMYLRDDNRLFDAASLYKLWVMMTVMDQLERGTIKETQELTAKAEELNDKFDIATEAAEIKTGEVKMTVAEAMDKMITISHNYAALLLTSRVRLSNVKLLLSRYGFIESHLNPPRTTASDLLAFYEKLHSKDLVTKSYSEKMIELLKKQQLNDRIPKYLPEDTEVAHKTGELGGAKHDAGIVFTEKGDYIIVVLSESKDPKAAAEREALLSKAVYEYFMK